MCPLSSIALLPFLTGPLTATAPETARPAWQEGTTTPFAGYRVTLSQPRLVARSPRYLWFPTLLRPPGQALFAVMSNYADEHRAQPTGLMARSTDGGRTWSAPREVPYGESALVLRNGDTILLPYYMRLEDAGTLTGSYLRLRRGESEWTPVATGITVSGWPRKLRPLLPDAGRQTPEGRVGSFVFNGQTVLQRDRRVHLATLYGHFAGTTRYSLALAESRDGRAWRIRSLIADETCKLTGAEGPCESALVRLKDGRLLCVFRMHSGQPYGQSFSADEGVTWSEPEAMRGPHSVQPSLAVLRDGTIVLAGGRPDLSLWICRDGAATAWDRVDVLANHNAFRKDEPIHRGGETPTPNTSAYMEVVALDAHTLLVVYDRVPYGWDRIPDGSTETNSVWVVRVRIQ